MIPSKFQESTFKTQKNCKKPVFSGKVMTLMNVAGIIPKVVLKVSWTGIGRCWCFTKMS